MSEDRLTCPHLGLDTRFPVHGPPRVVLDSIAAGGVDCEVCRKLLAFDDLLAACKYVYDRMERVRLYGAQERSILRDAIARAEGSSQ